MLKFIMLSITYFKKEGPHKILEKLRTDDKLKNLLRFYPFFFIRTPFP